jgi:small multidrug resistance pump
MTKWLLLAFAITIEVGGSLLLKGALGRPGLYVVVACCYIASFVLLGAVLQRGVPFGVAYAIWGALGVAATAVMGMVVFDEVLTPVMTLGMCFVVLGVIVVQVGSHVALCGRRDDL